MSNWPVVTIGELCRIVSGTTPSTSVTEYWGGSHNWVTPAELNESNQIVLETQRKITSLAVQKSGLRLLPVGTVLLSSRAPIGKVAIAGVSMYCNQGFKNLICSDRVHNKYLFWFLKSKTAYLNSIGRGATFKEISKSVVERILVPLPPIEKQKQIAATLDALSELIRLRKQQLEELDQLVKTMFVEMFKSISSNDYCKMSEVCSIITDGTHQPPKFTTSGIPFIFVSNINENVLTYDTVNFISEQTYAELSKRTPVEIGDVLLSTVGSYGHPAIVRESTRFSFQRHIAYLKPKRELVDSEYLYGAILSPIVQAQIESKVKGIAQKTLNLSEIRSILIPVPSIDHQKQFAVIVKQVHKMEREVKQAVAELKALKHCLLQECFP